MAERKGIELAERATEQHYTPQQIAAMWGVSAATVRRLFEDEGGVLRISMSRLSRRDRKQQAHVLLRIPASAVQRVHGQWAAGARLEVKGRGRGVE